MENAIIIFVRNPVQGKVKTRIAATLGEEAALKVYKKLLQQTKQTVSKLSADKYIFYADGKRTNDSWPDDEYLKENQAEGDLGEKMIHAFEKVCKLGYKKVLIIGSDCYELTPGIINDAFNMLNDYDVVLGPAADGGYYLLGKKKLLPSVFAVTRWSTDTVLDETIEQCRNSQLSYYLLPILHDVDEAKDISFEY